MRDYFRRPRKTHWLESLQPFLGFWPLHPEWIGPFSCLNLIPSRPPIRWWKDGLQWHLDSDMAVAWQNLEGKLVGLVTALPRRHITVRYDWSEIRASTLPYECGYMQHFRSSDDCARAVYASRNTFIMLTAFISFTVALDLSVRPLIEGTTPDWFFFAETQLHMDPVWLSELAESFVCNFTPGFHPGSYVRATQAVYKQTFPAYKAANVPLFINWGFRPQTLTDDDPVWRYCPCRGEARHAINLYCDQMPPADDPHGSIMFWYNMNTPGQSVVLQTPSRILHGPSLPVYDDDPPVVLEDSPASSPPHLQGEDDPPSPCVDGPQVLLSRLSGSGLM